MTACTADVDIEAYCLLGYDAVQCDKSLKTFRRNLLSPTYISKSQSSKQAVFKVLLDFPA
jgi:hypothetical protein